MQPPILNPAPRVGPYEAWIFGEVGAPYEGAPIAFDPIIACLGEVPGTMTDPQAMAAALALGAPGLSRLGKLTAFRPPTLWPEAFATPGGSGAHILPGLALFKTPIALMTRSVAPGAGDLFADEAAPPPPTPEYGYRLNAPVARPSYDAAFVDAPATLAPDPATKAWVDAHAPGLTGAPLVVVAVIDDGLPFAHPHLRGADGAPRVECCWLQGADAGLGAQAGRVLFGRELRRDDIAALAAAHGGDETSLYAQAGALSVGDGRWSPLAHAATHGAMALDLAAGYRLGSGATPQGADDFDRARVIGVSLPPAAVIDTTGFGLEAYILSAFHYVFRRADEIAAAYGLTRAQVPLIVNFSFGVSGGPHDGQDRLEEAIAHLVARRQALGAAVTVAMPSGNEFLAALHGELRAADATSGEATARWRTQPCDRTANYLEIWSPPSQKGAEAAGQPARLRLWPPGATAPLVFDFPKLLPAPPQITAPCAILPLEIGGRAVGQVSLDLFRGYRWRVMVILAPSETREPELATAPAGLWTVGVDVSRLGPDDVIACRIQRDNAARHPWQGGRQSWFDDPRDRTFDAAGAPAQDDAAAVFVRRFGTLNGFATHDGALVVAGCDAATGKPALYNSAGPPGQAPGGKNAVATAAPSDDSPALRGQSAAGPRAASVGRWIGVSAAAPQIARRAALARLDGRPFGPANPSAPASTRLGTPYA